MRGLVYVYIHTRVSNLLQVYMRCLVYVYIYMRVSNLGCVCVYIYVSHQCVYIRA